MAEADVLASDGVLDRRGHPRLVGVGIDDDEAHIRRSEEDHGSVERVFKTSTAS
jgi:hypothetical protein